MPRGWCPSCCPNQASASSLGHPYLNLVLSIINPSYLFLCLSAILIDPDACKISEVLHLYWGGLLCFQDCLDQPSDSRESRLLLPSSDQSVSDPFNYCIYNLWLVRNLLLLSDSMKISYPKLWVSQISSLGYLLSCMSSLRSWWFYALLSYLLVLSFIWKFSLQT